jgi:hypothetical protein
MSEESDIVLPAPPAGVGAVDVDTSSGTAYVAIGWLGGGIVVADVVTGTVVTTIPIPGYNLQALGVDSSTHTVYAAGTAADGGVTGYDILVIDGPTGTVRGVIASVPLGAAAWGCGAQVAEYVVVDASTHRVFAFDGVSKIDVIDGSASTVMTSITLPSPCCRCAGLAMDGPSNVLWAPGASTSQGFAYAIRASDGTIQSTYSYPNVAQSLTPAGGGNAFVVTAALAPLLVRDGPLGRMTFDVPLSPNAPFYGPAVAAPVSAQPSAPILYNQCEAWRFTSDGAFAGSCGFSCPTFPGARVYVAAAVPAGDVHLLMFQAAENASTQFLPLLKRVKPTQG